VKERVGMGAVLKDFRRQKKTAEHNLIFSSQGWAGENNMIFSTARG
jgi:hypothetical protein